MEDLLREARIPNADKVGIIQDSLVGYSKDLVESEENRLTQSILWDAFSMSFLTRFLSRADMREME